MRANGEEFPVEDGTVLSDWLVSRGYVLEKTAVLLNGNVVPRASLDSTVLSDTDCLEIVSFVGGG